MSKTRHISVCEYETIRIGIHGDDKTITQDECNQIYDLQDAARCLAFVPIRGGIKACQFIGVFSINSLNIEILPKIAKFADEKSHVKLRIRLVEIISRALGVDAKSDHTFSKSGESPNLLESLIYLFAKKVSEYTRRGLIRGYININDDVTKYRGKLLIQRQFTKHALMPNKIACNFDEYSANISFNRLLFCALHKIFKLTNSFENRRLIGETMERFSDVDLVDVKSILNEKFSSTRQLQPWKQIDSLARFILKNIYQTVSSGDKHGFCLLFDMNRIFEDYVANFVKEICPNVKAQSSTGYLCKYNKFKLRPDLLIKRDESILIVDTKWKLPNNKFSNSDAYQMFAYTEMYGAKRAILLYPTTYSKAFEDMEDVGGEQISIANKPTIFEINNRHSTKIEAHFINLESEKSVKVKLSELLAAS